MSVSHDFLVLCLEDLCSDFKVGRKSCQNVMSVCWGCPLCVPTVELSVRLHFKTHLQI